MKKSELEEIAEKLLDSYGDDRHFEIIKAEKTGHCEGEENGWRLEITEVKKQEEDDSEGAENGSN